MQIYLPLILCGFILAVIFFYSICEWLIHHERRKAERICDRYKSHYRDATELEAFTGKGVIPTAPAAAAAGGYILLPIHGKHQNGESNNKSAASPDKIHKDREDPRSHDAWTQQDSEHKCSFGDREEDPWICTKGAITIATPLTSSSKHVAEETPILEKETPPTHNAALTDAAAMAATGVLIDRAIGVPENVHTPHNVPNISTLASVEPIPSHTTTFASESIPVSIPKEPGSNFSTVGFWEAKEAAKLAESSGGSGYFGSSGNDGGGYNNGWGNDSSGGGAGGFGNDDSIYSLGNDYSEMSENGLGLGLEPEL